MDTDENQNNASSTNQGDDTVSDSVLDSMAAALESAGISLSPDAPQPTPEKRYSDEVIHQVMETMGDSDREGYIEFARSMDGNDNG